jgi:hypothetical protein
MNTEHTDYDSYITDLEEVASYNLIPAVNEDGTRALVQVKEHFYTSDIDWFDSPSACVIDTGDEDWASGINSDWYEE